MHCPQCGEATLHQRAAQRGTLVDVCSRCDGLWLDSGEILDFSARPQELDRELERGLHDARPSGRQCPRCHCALEQGRMPLDDVPAERCPSCGGLWFDGRSVRRLGQCDDMDLDLPEEETETDADAQATAHERHHALAAGLLALPNLVLRSGLTLVFLYGLVALVLITLSLFGVLGPHGHWVALAIGVAFAVFQFTCGPWLMDLSLRWLYKFRWLEPEEMPEHLHAFVERVCAEQRMRFPSVGLIDDGAPTAFTYGHHPSNARVVLSRGILELLEPEEVEAVVAHELGHARNWDMALMTVANLVPLLMYVLYRVALDRGRDKAYSWAVTAGAYVLYIVSEYVVLWFSRTREYYADRFAGQVTGNPNALGRALVKIAYGLAAQRDKPEAVEGEDKKQKKERQKAEQKQATGIAAIRALNIFDRGAAVGLVMASASRAGAGGLDVERVKGAMQWDLWNPWALYYELHSTHPLVAKRLRYLTDQASHQGQEPFVVFDRRKPESYWDEFFVDVGVMVLPVACFLLGGAAFVGAGLLANAWHLPLLGVAVLAAGVASLAKTRFVYRRDFFPNLSVAALLHKVKVSAVRPVPATLTGTIIGKGVPGLVWSEDFVLRDRTGIIFMDYRQPLAIWNFLFGLFRAGQYQGKEVRVSGWFRRAPVPYLEVNKVEVLDGSLPSRRCYSYHARLIAGFLLAAVGAALTAVALFANL
jgi:Zn-dependent protease with chaperone function